MRHRLQTIKVILSVYTLMGVGISFYGIKKLKNKIRRKYGRSGKKNDCVSKGAEEIH